MLRRSARTCLLGGAALLWAALWYLDAGSFNAVHLLVQRADEGTCRLLRYDPFDAVFLSHIEEDRKCKPLCVPQTLERSELVGQAVRMKSLADGEQCRFRCAIGRSHGGSALEHFWIRVGLNGSHVHCEVIELECTANSTITYRMTHYQVVRTELDSVVKDPKKPNLHVMVIDSAAMPMMYRALPKTMRYLKEALGSVFFAFNNKIGSNSANNGMAFMTGQRVDKSRPSPDAKPFPYIKEFNGCADNSTFIGKLFKKKGYRVMDSSDWPMNALSGCQPNDESPVDHRLTVFFRRRRQAFPETHVTNTLGPDGRHHYHSNLWHKYCHENHLIMFDMLEQFVKMYKDEPLLSMTWLGLLIHDYRPDLYMYDDDFLHFFQRITPYLDNSHFVFLADHGNRILWDRAVFLDRLEDYNPALIYIPPKNLRENPSFRKQTAINSQQLVTHFDTYTTFIDILENGGGFDGTTDFGMPSPDNIANLPGSSLLRVLKQPRNCESLGIPFEFCLCQTLGERQNGTELAKTVANNVIDLFNDMVASFDFGPKECAKLSLNTDFGPFLEEYKPGQYEDPVYMVTFKTKPGNALYLPHVRAYRNGTVALVIDRPPRMNRYGSQTLCLRDRANFHSPKWLDYYCFCKSLLNDAEEVNKSTG